MGFANLVGYAGIEQNSFGSGGLAGVNMGHNADIAQFVERERTRHSMTYQR